jgi:subtilisin family serine protease
VAGDNIVDVNGRLGKSKIDSPPQGMLDDRNSGGFVFRATSFSHPPPKSFDLRRSSWLIPSLCSVTSLWLITGCGGDGPNAPPPPPATQLALTAQPPSQAQSGIALSIQPVVQLLDDQGAATPLPGVSVSVSIASGGGSLIGATTVTTSSDGRATFAGLGIRGTLGSRTLSFGSPDLPPVISGPIELAAGTAAIITPITGNEQIGAVGTVVAISPSVKVSDADNNSVGGVPVVFQVTSGGGTVEPTSPVTTDADGLARAATWTLGPAAGPNTLSATLAGIFGPAAVFTATALVGGTIRGTITTTDQLESARAMRGLRSRSVGRPPEYTPDELIVTLRRGPIGAPPSGASSITLSTTAATVTGSIRSHLEPQLTAHAAKLTGVSPAISTARIRVAPAELTRVIAALRSDPAIASVERNAIMRSDEMSRSIPTRSSNDPLYDFQAWHYGMIDLPEAWAITTGSSSVLVAVVDDGIRFDHPAIAANLTSDGYDFVANSTSFPLCGGGGRVSQSGDGDDYDPDPTDPGDYSFDRRLGCAFGLRSSGNHGLHVAGTIGAAGNDGIGVTGIDWAVRIRPIRVLGTGGGTAYDVAQGILYAGGLPADGGGGTTVQAPTGAKIINLSLGGGDSPVLRDAVVAATGAGSLIVASAGNSALPFPEYPAAYPQVLCVAAVGADRQLASYSNSCPTSGIAAPGGNITDQDEIDFGIMSTTWNFKTSTPRYDDTWVGTSMAAPHASGVAALLLAQNPGLSASELRSRLTDFAVDAGPPGRDNLYGAGILNARNSLARNLEPAHQLHAVLYDAVVGAALQSVTVAANGSYTFVVPDGSYRVFAGQDEEGDQLVGLPGRRWGAFGSSARPTNIDVSGTDTHQASFAVGFPRELEPNGTRANANVLPVGGYLIGQVNRTEEDMTRVLISQEGQYTFETSAVDGVCGFALEADTRLELHDATGALLTSNDNIDSSARNLCSRLTMSLAPGTYYLGVRGNREGRYRVQARSGL